MNEAIEIIKANPTTVEALTAITWFILGGFVMCVIDLMYIRKLERQLADKECEIELRVLFTREWRDKAHQLENNFTELQGQFDQMERIAEYERGQRLAAEAKYERVSVFEKNKGSGKPGKHGKFEKKSKEAV